MPVPPFVGPVRGAATLPGSKSLTNRALLLAALVDGPVRLTGVLFSRDTRLMLAALRTLGFAVQEDEAACTVEVVGRGGVIPVGETSIDVGNAGTVARFLTAFLCLHPRGCFWLDGDPAMRRRPMAGLLDALAALGARFTFHGEPGCFPFTLNTKGIPGGDVTLDASASSQLLSALLLVGPACGRPLAVRLAGSTVSAPFVELTRAVLGQFGQQLPPVGPDGAHHLPAGRPYQVAGGTYAIEPDATAASYFMVLPRVVGGHLSLPGLPPDPLQGDAAFAGILPDLGLAVERTSAGWSVAVAGAPAAGPRRIDFNPISDTFLTLAALAPLLPGETWIHGIAHTRHQETDRVAAMAEGLRRLGQGVEETADGDGLRIRPDRAALERLAGNARQGLPLPVLDTFEDHRVAMSFGILGCHDLTGTGIPWLALADPACCRKTFPSFFHQLERLRAAARAGTSTPPPHP